VNVFNIVFFLLWRSRRDAGLALMPWIMQIGNECGLRGADTRRSYRWTVRQFRSRQRETVSTHVVRRAGTATL